jgi:hypothetical protein
LGRFLFYFIFFFKPQILLHYTSIRLDQKKEEEEEEEEEKGLKEEGIG